MAQMGRHRGSDGMRALDMPAAVGDVLVAHSVKWRILAYAELHPELYRRLRLYFHQGSVK